MKKKVILYIDTKDQQEVKVGLFDGEVKKEISAKKKIWTSQLLLPLIKKILDKNKIKLNQLTEIKAIQGPGSYTGLRVGISVANALAFLLEIPVNGKRNKLAEPKYQ